MIRQQQGNRIGVDLDRPGVNVLRGDMDEMRKMTRALDGFTINVNEIHRGRPYDHSKSMKQARGLNNSQIRIFNGLIKNH